MRGDAQRERKKSGHVRLSRDLQELRWDLSYVQDRNDHVCGAELGKREKIS